MRTATSLCYLAIVVSLLNAPLIRRAVAGETTILLVDDHEVQYRAGTRRVLASPTRHPDNPLIVGPAKGDQIGYCSVYRDSSSGRHQMWYQISSGGRTVCYAESIDGIRWNLPELGIVPHQGKRVKNGVFTSPDHYGASVVVDPSAGDPLRRYKLAYWSIPPIVGAPAYPGDDRGPDGGLYVAFSPDGIHWTEYPGLRLRGAYGRSRQPPLIGEHYPWGVPGSVSDVIDACYDPIRKVYVIYAKTWIDAPDGALWWKRAITRTESPDFVQWSTPQLMLAPDELDGKHPAEFGSTRKGVQLHGAPVFIRHGIYFALMQVADFESHGKQPIELAISRDGINWSRPFRDRPFLPAGQEGAFDASRIWSSTNPIQVGDELRFYYGAYEHPWEFGAEDSVWKDRKRIPKSGIGLATLAVDRFASLRPITKVAQVTLKPRSLAGVRDMTLNANAAGGAVRVELLDSQGYRVPKFTKEDTIPIGQDGLRQPVRWKNSTLRDLPSGLYSIRIHLDQAEVFGLTLAMLEET